MSLPSSTENNSSLNEHYGFKFLKKVKIKTNPKEED